MTVPARILAIVIAALVLIGALAMIFQAWQTARGRAAQGRVTANQTRAAQGSAKDAIGAVAASGAREAAIADKTRTNEKEIRDAKGANDAVDPAVRDAGFAGLCRRTSARDDPKCLRFTVAK